MKTYKQLYEEAKKAKSLRALTPAYHKWEKGDEQIVGAYISQNAVQGSMGGISYNQYIFETDKGRIKFALGRAADGEFGDMFVRGLVYSVTFKGKERISGGRSVNRFEVEEIGLAAQLDDTQEEEGSDDGTLYKK